MTDTLSKVVALRDDLDTNLLERDAAIDAAILALVTREHALFLGPPGTAKSLLVRSVCERIEGAGYLGRPTRTATSAASVPGSTSAAVALMNYPVSLGRRGKPLAESFAPGETAVAAGIRFNRTAEPCYCPRGLLNRRAP
jgi:hypothetical protein